MKTPFTSNRKYFQAYVSSTEEVIKHLVSVRKQMFLKKTCFAEPYIMLQVRTISNKEIKLVFWEVRTIISGHLHEVDNTIAITDKLTTWRLHFPLPAAFYFHFLREKNLACGHNHWEMLQILPHILAKYRAVDLYLRGKARMIFQPGYLSIDIHNTFYSALLDVGG
jgi:hypothetical protein